MDTINIRSMEYYNDRINEKRCIEIADDLLDNRIFLLPGIYCEPSAKNIFETVFQTSLETNRERLLAMDYLSSLLSAYRRTNNPLYAEKFLEIIGQFFDYCDRGLFFLKKRDDLIVCAQTLMFIKSFSLIHYETELKKKIVSLLYSYAKRSYDDRNYNGQNNHGMFMDIALLHLSVLFDAPDKTKGNILNEKNKERLKAEVKVWRKHVLERIKWHFDHSFDEDGFNNEGSLFYFHYNLSQYRKILEFCDYYKISGLEKLRRRIEKSEYILQSFAHSDNSLPLIGDGQEILYSRVILRENPSAVFSKAGICVLRVGDVYMTFKCKAALQNHTHVDDTAITVRYQAQDLVLDCGHFNYNRSHPINRHVTTSGGHSGIYPLFVDGLLLEEYLERRTKAAIDEFKFDEARGRVHGGYELDDGDIKVNREITVTAAYIKISDSWTCKTPQNMRQRFVLPKEMLIVSKFTAQKHIFEAVIGDLKVKYEISSEIPIVTTMNFGVMSKQYEQYETTLLLDTLAEHSLRGQIMAVISWET